MTLMHAIYILIFLSFPQDIKVSRAFIFIFKNNQKTITKNQHQSQKNTTKEQLHVSTNDIRTML